MALTGFLIERYNNMGNSYTCYRLMEEAKLLGMSLRLIGVADTYIRDGFAYNGTEQLASCDFVINRFKVGRLREHINRLAKRTYNDCSRFGTFVNKYEQLRFIKSDKFSVPRYVLSMASIGYSQLTDTLGLPFVAKGLESSMGREVFLIACQSDFENLRNLYGDDKEWLFEEFIRSSVGKDLRIFSVRGEAIAAMERKSTSDFRANVALGATVSSVSISDEIRDIAKDIYSETELDFVGIDLLFGESGYYFCEVNVMPGIEGIERATGVNIGRAIMKTIKNDFYE